MSLKPDPKDFTSDTLTMFLCFAVNRYEPVGIRASKIRKLAKAIYKRTKDREMKRAMKMLYKEVYDAMVIESIKVAHKNYWRVRDEQNAYER